MAYHYENSSMSQLTEFVDSMLQQRFPSSGEAFEVKMQGKSYRFTRPDDSDSLLEHVCFSFLFLQKNFCNFSLFYFRLN